MIYNYPYENRWDFIKIFGYCKRIIFKIYVARRGAHLAAKRSPSGARADGARRSVAVPNGEGVASGSATYHILHSNP